MNDLQKLELLTKYADQVAKFRELCIKHGSHEVFEQVDFHNFSFGFFIALGVTGVTGDSSTDELFYDAHILSTICRYNLNYWEGETL
jgi:hypothetical protein